MKLAVVFHRPGAFRANLERALRSLSSKDVIEIIPPQETFVATHDSSESVVSFLDDIEQGYAGTRASFLALHPSLVHLDVSSSYGEVLPGPFASLMLPDSLSDVVNEAITVAESDYLLVMSPTEVCIDPENIGRTLAFLENRPAISVVCCPVHVYDSGEHVATTMEPKIFRVSAKTRAAGPTAERHEPSTENNHLLAASGFDFRDHDYVGRTAVDLKLRLRYYQKKIASGVRPEKAATGDDRQVVLGLARELLRSRPSVAVEILRPVVDSLLPTSPFVAAPLAALGRALDMVGATEQAGICFDASLGALRTPDALLARGLHRKRNGQTVRRADGQTEGGDWRTDLEEATRLVREVTSYGLDLRELKKAAKLLADEGTRGRGDEGTKI